MTRIVTAHISVLRRLTAALIPAGVVTSLIVRTVVYLQTGHNDLQ